MQRLCVCVCVRAWLVRWQALGGFYRLEHDPSRPPPPRTQQFRNTEDQVRAITSKQPGVIDETGVVSVIDTPPNVSRSVRVFPHRPGVWCRLGYGAGIAGSF